MEDANHNERFSPFTFTEDMVKERIQRLLQIEKPSLRDWIEMYTIEFAFQNTNLWDKLFDSESATTKSAVKKYIFTNFRAPSVTDILFDFEELKNDQNTYFNDFWKILVLRDDLRRLSEKDFSKLLDSNVVPLFWVLEERNLVIKYDAQVKDALLADTNNFEHVFRQQTEPSRYHYTFPSSITNKEWYDLAIRYVENQKIFGAGR